MTGYVAPNNEELHSLDEMPSFAPNVLIEVARYTDIHLPVKNPGNAVLFPGRVSVRTPDKEFLVQFLEFLSKRLVEYGTNARGRSFRVELPNTGLQWRVQEIRSDLFAMRATKKTPPILGRDVKLRNDIEMQLLNPNLKKEGGLILISGIPGSGKTWTAMAAMIARLRKFGGYLLTIEDPIETKFEGFYQGENGETGYCEQMDASDIGYKRAISNSLRCFPAGERAMLFIGEIRESEPAAEMLRIAIGGHLVFTTVHAEDHKAACQRIISLAQDGGEPDAKRLLASALRLSINQKLEGGIMQASMLQRNQQVQSMIANGDYSQFGTAVDQQNRTLTNVSGQQRPGVPMNGNRPPQAPGAR